MSVNALSHPGRRAGYAFFSAPRPRCRDRGIASVMARVVIYVRRPRGGAGGRSTRRGGASGSNLARTSVGTARKTHKHTPCGRAAERYMTPSLGMKPLTELLEYRPLFPPRYRVRQPELCKNTIPREISDVTQADSVAPQLTRQAVQRLKSRAQQASGTTRPIRSPPRLRGRGPRLQFRVASARPPASEVVQWIAVHRRVTQPRARHGHLATVRSKRALRERRRLKPRDDPRELLVTARGENVDRLAMVKRDQWTVEPYRHVLLVEHGG